MPDDPNLFDDADFWSGETPGSTNSAGGARPPWQSHPGDPSAMTGARPAELPPWQQHPASSTPARSAPMQPPPWQAHPGPTPTPPPGGQPGEPAWDEIGWAVDQPDADRAASAAGADELPQGLTGMLPWRSETQSAPAGPPSSADDSAWLESFGQTGYDSSSSLPQDDGDLSWLTGDSSKPVEPAAETGADGLLWPDDDLFAGLEADSTPPAETETAPSSGVIRRLARPQDSVPPAVEAAQPQADLTVEDLFDSAFGDAFEDILGESASGTPADAGTAGEGDADLWPGDEAAAEKSFAEEQPPAAGDLPDWLRTEATPPSAPLAEAWGTETAEADTSGEEETLPAWAEDGASFAAQSTPTNLSYDEWEQAQIAREQEAAKTEEDRLLEQVPDWFAQPDQPAAPAPDSEHPAGPEFVPDWFTGLEAQNLEAAPDWFQKIDYTADPLAAPPSEPEPPPVHDAVMPDWLRPDGLLELAGQEESPAESEQPAADEWAVDEPLPDEIDFLNRLGGASSGRGKQPPAPPPAPPAAAPGDEEWRRAFEPSPEPEFAQAPPPVGDFVERFDPFAPVEPAPPPAPEAAAFDLGPGTLDWLQDLSAEDLSEPEPEPVFPAEQPAAPEPEPAEDLLLEEVKVDSQAIDSLLGISDSSMALVVPQEQPVAAPEEITSFEWPEEDPWLALEKAEAAADERFAGAEVFPEEQAAEDLLAAEIFEADRPTTPERPATAAKAAPAPPPAEEPPVAPREAARPQWLEEMRPADLPVTLIAGGARLDMIQHSLDDLPDGLRSLHERLSDEQSFAEATRSVQPPPESGPLAGIVDSLSAVPAALPTIRREAIVEGLVISPEEQRRIERLQAVLDLLAAEEEEAEEAPVEGFGFSSTAPFDFGGEEVDEEAAAVAEISAKSRPRRPHRYKFDRLVILLAMLAALVVPFVTDVVHFAADPPPLAGDQAAVASAVDALLPGDIALVALEYGPTAAGELDGLAEAVLRDIIAQRAVPVMISTNPAAALHAEAVIAPLRDDSLLLKARGDGESALAAGEDYVLLAYLPGEAVGVRSLAQPPSGAEAVHPAFKTDLRGEETALTVHNMATDVALIVVVSEDSAGVRTWAEQLESVPTLKVALVTAATEPLVEPYVNAKGYVGYLAGVRDTYSYNAARNSTTREPYVVPEGITFDVPDPESARWHSMALGAAAAAAVIALGTMVNLIRALGRRRSR